MKKFLQSVFSILALFCLLIFSNSAIAETVDEDAIFSEDKTVADSKTVLNEKTAQSIEKESVSFTGFLNSRTSYDMSREWLKDEKDGYDKNTFLSYFQSNYSLDVRLRKNMKGFANASLNYFPAGTQVTEKVTHTPIPLGSGPTQDDYETKTEYVIFHVEELFADINFNRIAYLRVGKQFLKWGTGILWTPSDLINVDKKNILDPSQVREGTYGAKLSIPFGTVANFYTFANMNNANNVDQLSSASKMEVLIGKTEVSVSVLARKGSVPVYGFDFSSRLFTLDIHGEASTSYGDPEKRLNSNKLYTSHEPMPTYKRDNKWITCASFGFGRSFEFLDIADRIRIDAEFFYNGRGYKDDIFERQDAVFFVRNGLYTPNYYGIYYGGLFLTYNRLFIQDLNFSLYYIRNISDESSVISGNFAYNYEYNVSLNLTVNGYLGKQNREYTIGMNSSSVSPEEKTRALLTEFMIKMAF
jgi:hypothetical protein